MKRNDWRTPKKLYQYLNGIWQFTVDAAADKKNHLHERYWTEKDNALKQDWTDEVVFCNPPYSLCKEFAHKAIKNLVSGCLLMPVRSDRIWYNELLENFYHCNITGRLHFDDSGKGAFMYSVLVYKHPKGKVLPPYMQAGQFNANGKGDART